LEGILTRGDRRVAVALEEAWRRGARLDGWSGCFDPERWWQTFADLRSEVADAHLWWQRFADLGIDVAWYSQRTRPMDEVLPWDHVNVKKGREYLEKEETRRLLQLEVMADAK